LKCQVSGEEGQSPEPSGLPASPCLHPAADQFSRQPNPISDGNNAGQVLSGAGVTDDSSLNCPQKTNPIPREVSSLKCQVSSQENQSPEPSGLPTSPCHLHLAAQQFSRQTNPISPAGAGWDGAPGAGDAGQLRQTNPMSDGDDAGQGLSHAGVTDDSSPDRPGKTKPIYPAGAGPPADRPGQFAPRS
jgi:hypothetical protein